MRPDTTALDNVIFGRVDPHIYAFTTGTVPNYLKVGDTYRPVEVRLAEWERVYQNLQKQYEHSAKVDEENEVYFRDYAVHDFLVRHKCQCLQREDMPFGVYYSNEFFRKIDSENTDEVKQEVIAAIKDIRRDYNEQTNRYKFYNTPFDEHDFKFNRGPEWPLRDNQNEAVKAFNKAVSCGRDKLLMYAVMRFGKSFTALCCAKEMNAKLVYVVSAKAEVSTEWQKNVQVPGDFDGYEFYNIDSLKKNVYRKEKTIQSLLDEGKRVVVFLTLQDLSGSVEKLKAKHKELFNLTADMIIVDETHFAARAEHYGIVLQGEKYTKDKRNDGEETDKKDEEGIENIRCLNKPKVTLHLSGTPYRILMGSEFSQEDIISFCQYNDILEAQKQWDLDNPDKDEWENPYFGFPQMVRFALNPSKSAREKLKELRKEGYTYTYSELLMPQSINKDAGGKYKQFKHEKEVLEMFQAIDGSREDDELFGFLDYDKLKYGKMCQHIVCVLPYCASCDALEQLLKDYACSFKNLQEYEIINISGVDAKTVYRKPEDVKHKISECEKLGKKTITLTVNRMLTGSTVKQWDTMLYFKDTSSPQEYDQAIFRLQSQNVREIKDEEGNTIKINLKPQTLLVDFNPDRMFHLQAQKSLVYNVNTEIGGNNELESRIERELRVSPIFMLNKDKIQEVEPEDIMDAVSRYSSDRSAIDEATDIEVDTSLMTDNEILQIVKTLAKANSSKGIMNDAYKKDTDTGLKTGDEEGGNVNAETNSETPQPPTSSETADATDNPVADFKQRFRTFYIKLLFYAFLTDDDVKSLEDVIHSLGKSENKRIAEHAELDLSFMKAVQTKVNKRILCDLDFAIRRINELANDKSVDKLQRTLTCIRKFDRISNTEIITPPWLADKMANVIPEEKLNGKILDIASKTGEFTVALYERMKRLNFSHDKITERIYALPTSGLTYEFTRKVFEALDLNLNNIITTFNAYDLVLGDKQKEYIQQLKDMNITSVIGNPPYNMPNEGNGNGSNPLYHQYIDRCKDFNGVSTLIHPARFLFNAGKTPKDWNKQMLNDTHFKVVNYWVKSSDVFPVAEINGGVVVTYRDNAETFDVIDFFSPFEELISIYKKVKAKDDVSFSTIVGPRELYNITNTLYEENPAMEGRQSKGHKFSLGANIFKVFQELFSDTCEGDASEMAQVFGRFDNRRCYKWVKRAYISQPDNFSKYKVILSKSDGSAGKIGNPVPARIIGKAEIGDLFTAYTDTFIGIGCFETREEAEACHKYLQTKFARTMLGTVKVTQDNPKETWINVPLQDFTPQSDIDWSKSISEIDQQLYDKYGLTEEEQSFIEKMIKPME